MSSGTSLFRSESASALLSVNSKLGTYPPDPLPLVREGGIMISEGADAPSGFPFTTSYQADAPSGFPFTTSYQADAPSGFPFTISYQKDVQGGRSPPLKPFPPLLQGRVKGRRSLPYITNSPSPFQGEGDKGDRDTNKNLRG